MSVSKVFFTVVIVLHNFAYSLSNPVIWTARDSLSTENKNPIEIVTPISQSKIVFKEKEEEEEEILPTKMPYFPTESSYTSTEISYVPRETSYYHPTKIPDFPKEENKTIPMPIKNGIINRIPKFLGRLAFLAGLGLAGLANAASAIDLDPKDPQTPSTLNLPPAKLSPYFAAVYEPFSFSSQPNFYSNLFGLFPFLAGTNPQKFQTGGPSSVPHNPHQQLFAPPDATGHEVANQELYHEEYVVENRKDDNNTMQESKSGGNMMEQKKSKPTKATILQEDTTSNLSEEQELEEGENAEEREDIEENDESTEDSEENSDSENLSYEVFSSTEEQTTLKPFKRPVRPAQQNRATTTRRSKKKKPTKRKSHKKPTTTKHMKMKNDTNPGNATTMGYPYFYGYYGGNAQNIHDIFITSSEKPHQHHEGYNEFPHYSEDWSNRGPMDHNYHDGFPDPHFEYRFPLFDQVIPSENAHFFRGFPVMETTSSPAFINTGFKPSYQYS